MLIQRFLCGKIYKRADYSGFNMSTKPELTFVKCRKW